MSTILPRSTEVHRLDLQTRVLSFVGYVATFIHRNRTTCKVAQLAIILVGIRLLGTPFISRLTPRAILKTISGILLLKTSQILDRTIGMIAPPEYSMSMHLYRESEYEVDGSIVGKLRYQNDIPILTLTSNNPSYNGHAHGFLCGEAINFVSARYMSILQSVLGVPKSSDLKVKFLEQIRSSIPKQYMEEMEGLVKGYNEWRVQHPHIRSNELSLNDVILLHLLPDIATLKLDQYKKGAKSSQVKISSQYPMYGCTAVLSRNHENNTVFDRNLDWPTLGTGRYFIVIEYVNSPSLPAISRVNNHLLLSYPGLIGCLTGINAYGLTIAMNVAKGNARDLEFDSDLTPPSAFFNRMCLDLCKDVNEVKEFARTHSPIGPYHMTTADGSGRGTAIHFYQGELVPGKEYQSHIFRDLNSNDDEILTVFNCQYSETGEVPGSDISNDTKRKQAVMNHFDNCSARHLRERFIPLNNPPINTWQTSQSIRIIPEKQTIAVSFGDAFVGKKARQEIKPSWKE